MRLRQLQNVFALQSAGTVRGGGGRRSSRSRKSPESHPNSMSSAFNKMHTANGSARADSKTRKLIENLSPLHRVGSLSASWLSIWFGSTFLFLQRWGIHLLYWVVWQHARRHVSKDTLLIHRSIILWRIQAIRKVLGPEGSVCAEGSGQIEMKIDSKNGGQHWDSSLPKFISFFPPKFNIFN